MKRRKLVQIITFVLIGFAAWIVIDIILAHFFSDWYK